MAGNTVPAIIDISMAPALIKEMEPPVEPPPHHPSYHPLSFSLLLIGDVQLDDDLTASRVIGGTQGTPSMNI